MKIGLSDRDYHFFVNFMVSPTGKFSLDVMDEAFA